MTRRRSIAGVILLAAVVVAVPLVPGMWERVAYRDSWAFLDGFMLREKRAEWLPGAAGYVPNQVCRACLSGDEGHGHCSRLDEGPRAIVSVQLPEILYVAAVQVPERLRSLLDEDESLLAWYPESFRCTCTDPSHDGEFE